MKKLIVAVLILPLILGVGAAMYWIPKQVRDDSDRTAKRAVILRVAIVTDSHNNNDLLARALAQARGMGVDFVIGLGDYTNTGTLDELNVAKNVFDASGLTYYVTAGDHDLWDSRDKQLKGDTNKDALSNFRAVFGEPSHEFTEKEIHFVILDNSDIYLGIDQQGWRLLAGLNPAVRRPLQGLTLVFAHKTPYHPDSAHIMGEQTPAVAKQANLLIELIEATRPCHSGDDPPIGGEDSRREVSLREINKTDSGRARMTNKLCPVVNGFFSGDLHFFANFNSPNGSVKMTTIGAVTRQPNPQGPRFGVLTVYQDYSWEVADIEIR